MACRHRPTAAPTRGQWRRRTATAATRSSSAAGGPGWERPSRNGRPEHAALLAAALATTLVVLVPTALSRLAVAPVSLDGGDEPGAASGSTAGPAADPEAAVADALSEAPVSRIQLAFLHLDDPLERAVSVLGQPDRRHPDINAAHAHVWALPGGGELTVTADDTGVVGLHVRVPPGGPTQLRAYGGVLLGTSTAEDVAAAWGPDYSLGHGPGDDFALRYIDCVGPFPVVVKFAQEHDAGNVRWEEPVTSVLIAYADAEPGSHGCGPPA